MARNLVNRLPQSAVEAVKISIDYHRSIDNRRHSPSKFEKALVPDLTRSPVQTTAAHTSLTIGEEPHVMSIRDNEER
ncbi:hypothetical protein U1Q18_006241, partial [Sarracenia purpurea var. burkii]